MNKKITMYELLGLVKDGKAPKKIRITGNIYEFDEYYNFYITEDKNNGFKVILGGLNSEINLLANVFNENVEILEEDKKENEIPNINLDNMKDIGAKVGKAYRELFEGFNKGWNTSLKEEKEIPEKLDHLISYDIQQFDDLKEYVEITTSDLFGKVNKIIDTLNQLSDYLKSKGE